MRESSHEYVWFDTSCQSVSNVEICSAYSFPVHFCLQWEDVMSSRQPSRESSVSCMHICFSDEGQFSWFNSISAVDNSCPQRRNTLLGSNVQSHFESSGRDFWPVSDKLF